MPVRGAKVRRSKWFNDITQALQERGFQRGAPGRMACPGFYFFNRDRFVIQILPENTLHITRPDGTARLESARELSKVNSILDALVLDIEFPEVCHNALNCVTEPVARYRERIGFP
jgi:hypothetical protein